MGGKISKIEYEIKPTVILVEGVDTSGKGFLIHHLGKKWPVIVIKNTKRPKNGEKKETALYKEYVKSILDFINHNRRSKIIVIDRLFPSEMVYSDVKRGYEAFADPTYKIFEKSLACRDHLYIYCNPGHAVLLKRFKERGDDYINEKDLKRLEDRYDRFFQETIMHKLDLDTSKSPDEMLEIIAKKINEYTR